MKVARLLLLLPVFVVLDSIPVVMGVVPLDVTFVLVVVVPLGDDDVVVLIPNKSHAVLSGGMHSPDASKKANGQSTSPDISLST